MKAKKKPIEHADARRARRRRRAAAEDAEGRGAAQAPGRRQGRRRRRAGRQAQERSEGDLNGRPGHRRARQRGAARRRRCNAVTAAAKLGGDVHVLVAGTGCRAAAEAAAKIAGVDKVLLADEPRLRARAGRERRRRWSSSSPPDYSHVARRRRPRSARTSCRASRRCSTWRRSPTSSRSIAPDTFERPIYAGNALATVQSTDAIKVITVRGTAFDAGRRERRQRRDRDASATRPTPGCRASSRQELSAVASGRS